MVKNKSQQFERPKRYLAKMMLIKKSNNER